MPDNKMVHAETKTLSCPTCGRRRPGTYTRAQTPLCRDQNGAECKAVAAERVGRPARTSKFVSPGLDR